MLGWVDIRTFGLSLHLIIGAVVVGFLVLGLAIVAWAAFRALAWRSRSRQAQQEAAQAHLRDDGLAYPPADRGLCDVCARVFEKVYHLPSGQRMCEDCYRQMVQESHERAFCDSSGAPQTSGETGDEHERRDAGIDAVHPPRDGRQGL